MPTRGPAVSGRGKRGSGDVRLREHAAKRAVECQVGTIKPAILAGRRQDYARIGVPRPRRAKHP